MARPTDVLVASARETMRAAADHIKRGTVLLEDLRRELAGHPDFRKAETAFRHKGSTSEVLTLVWWLHNCVHGILEDSELEHASMDLVDDAYHAERHLRLFIETERRDIARIASKRAA